jgi:TctA family transporter
MVFLQRPISATMLVVSALALAVVLLPSLRKKREEAFEE